MMKTRIIAVFALLSTVFIGCKNEKSTDATPEQIEQQQAADEVFKVTLHAVVKQDDNFQVYYRNDDQEFAEERSVWVAVAGKPEAQDIVFNMPEDVKPSLIRIDLGVNDKQEDITLYRVDLNYIGTKFTAEGGNLQNFFRPLDKTEIDFTTGVIKAKVENGKRVEPALYPHEVPLRAELDKL
jgi:hypothetical protein